MYFLRKEEVSKSTNLGPFIIFTENTYYGVFTKKNGKLKNIGNLVSLPTRVLPKEFRKNFDFVEDVVKFLVAKKSGVLYIKVYYEGEELVFEGLKFKNHISKFKLKGNFNKTFENFLEYNNRNMLKLSSIILNILPNEVLNLISNQKIVYIEFNDSAEKIPIELIRTKKDVVIKRIMSSNKRYFSKNYFKNIVIIGNSWDNRFKHCYLEGEKVFQITKKRFSSEFICDKISLEEFSKLAMQTDSIFISSHSNNDGIDLGGFLLNKNTIKLIPKFPKMVFLNNCYFEGIENIIRYMLVNGTISVIYSPFRIPDSKETMYFTSTFFDTFSKSYNTDLAFFIASKSSKEKRYYNHLLYRFCI
ncbi:MAG: hypothetical protein ACK4F9_02020 [Brevinematia bacterium]